MQQFIVMPSSQLSEKDFDTFPVWSEHYDYDELEDFERWGLDRETVMHLIETNSIGNEHCVYTLLEANPFPPRMYIYIRAKLRTASGLLLKGYILNEEAACLGVFHNKKRFIFNPHPLIKDRWDESLSDLAHSMGVDPASIFPIHYETEFTSMEGNIICGEFP